MYGSRVMETGVPDDLFYSTAHPYTRALLNCLPEKAVMEKRKRLDPIKGAPLDLMMMPPGCVFAARCDDCMKLCLKRKAELCSVPGGEEHFSCCWLSMLGGADG
jgi:oligopeptide transport system ATP-binding protein